MRRFLKLFRVFTVLLALAHFVSAQADESANTTIKNSSEDVKASTKKTVRNIKRKTRKAAGTDTAGKDIKDSVNDAGDDINKNAKKTKNKIEDNQ